VVGHVELVELERHRRGSSRDGRSAGIGSDAGTAED